MSTKYTDTFLRRAYDATQSGVPLNLIAREHGASYYELTKKLAEWKKKNGISLKRFKRSSIDKAADKLINGGDDAG